jgi:hypothetical protein
MLSALAQKELKELMRQSTVALQPKAKPVMAARNVAPKREVRYSRHAKEALREYKMQLNGWVPSQDGEEATAAEFIALGRCFQLTEGAETPANAAESVERFHGCDPMGYWWNSTPRSSNRRQSSWPRTSGSRKRAKTWKDP